MPDAPDADKDPAPPPAGKAPRPTSVRDALGSRPPRPVHAGQSRSERASAHGAGQRAGRPTPARTAMGTSREAPPRTPSRTVRLGEGEGAEWVVRVEGIATTGLPPDRGAPLLFLTFTRGEAPDAPVREALAVGRSLDLLSERQLDELLARSRPLSAKPESGAIFPDTRRPRGGGKR